MCSKAKTKALCTGVKRVCYDLYERVGQLKGHKGGKALERKVLSCFFNKQNANGVIRERNKNKRYMKICFRIVKPSRRSCTQMYCVQPQEG